MECEFVTLKYKVEEENIVKKKFEERQEEDRYENGHSYSGGIGMATGLTFTGENFDTYNAAEQYLLDNCQKWEDALAVKYKNKEGKEFYLIGAMCSS